MKTSRKSKNNLRGLEGYILSTEKVLVYIYLFCMLGIFPLHYEYSYSKIGNIKYEFFWNTSLVFLVASVVFFIAKIVLEMTGGRFQFDFSKMKEKLSFMDYAVGSYGICVVISYLLSPYKDYGFYGATGWEMGLCSQLIFVLLYFFISRQAEYGPVILGIHMVTSFVTYVLGILHRFQIDPLGMYEGLNLKQMTEFLSTIGQATWFSSYVCVGFAMGVAVFFVSHTKWIRQVAGVYTVASFGVLVTQNSDSAYIAIAGVFLLLGYFSLKDIKNWCRFWEIVSMMWATFGVIGILQKVFADRAVPLNTLSTFFAQSIVTWILLAVSLGILFFYKSMEKQGKEQVMKITKKVYIVLLCLIPVAFVAMIIFIYLNTKGYLLEWFGYQSYHEYLLFNHIWGSSRGAIWMSAMKGFVEMPFIYKLFGIGPDSLAPYIYTIPEVSELLQSMWGETVLTNAHNEYLNSLVCYGVVGLASWLAVIAGGIRYFYGKAKQNPVMIGIALCIIGYACHNVTCYQQVCCTPFLFIALGIGESLTKSQKFNTIK